MFAVILISFVANYTCAWSTTTNPPSIYLNQTSNVVSAEPDFGPAHTTYNYTWLESIQQDSGFTISGCDCVPATGLYVEGSGNLTCTFTPVATGIYYFKLRASYGSGSGKVIEYSDVSNVTVTKSLSVTVSSLKMDVGQSDVITANVSEGKSPYIYQWAENGNTITENNTITFTSTYPGTYTLNVIVTDNAITPQTVTSNAIVIVNVTPTAILTPRNTAMTVGQADILTASLTSGIGPFNVNFVYSNGTVANTVTGVPYNGAATYVFVPSGAGTATFNAVVTDEGTTSPFVFNSTQVSISVSGAPEFSLLTLSDNITGQNNSTNPVLTAYIRDASGAGNVIREQFYQSQLPATLKLYQNKTANLFFACSFIVNSVRYNFSGNVYGIGNNAQCNRNYTVHGGNFEGIYGTGFITLPQFIAAPSNTTGATGATGAQSSMIIFVVLAAIIVLSAVGLYYYLKGRR